MPASSAICASRRLSSQVPDQRSGTLVTARPEEQLAPNSPIFSAWPPASRLRCGNDEFAFGTIIPQACAAGPLPDAASSATPISRTNIEEAKEGASPMTKLMRAIALGAALSGFRLGVRPAISDQAGEDHHPVPGGRRDRSGRTADRAETVGEARPAVLHREHRRRRRQSRHGAGRARAGRRLHRAAVVIEHHGEPEPLQQDAVRRGEGSDPGHQGRRLAELVAGQSETSRPRT